MSDAFRDVLFYFVSLGSADVITEDKNFKDKKSAVFRIQQIFVLFESI